MWRRIYTRVSQLRRHHGINLPQLSDVTARRLVCRFWWLAVRHRPLEFSYPTICDVGTISIWTNSDTYLFEGRSLVQKEDDHTFQS